MNQPIDNFFMKSETSNKLTVWKRFVGRNAEYFVVKWLSIEGGQPFSFNWSAFFFGTFWMLYRKMYVVAVLWLVAIGVLELVELVLNRSGLGNSTTSLLFYWIPSLICGFVGNWLYFQSANHKIQLVKSKYGSSDEFLQELEIRGGVSISAVLIGVMFLLGIVSLIIQFSLGFFPYQ